MKLLLIVLLFVALCYGSSETLTRFAVAIPLQTDVVVASIDNNANTTFNMTPVAVTPYFNITTDDPHAIKALALATGAKSSLSTTFSDAPATILLSGTLENFSIVVYTNEFYCATGWALVNCFHLIPWQDPVSVRVHNSSQWLFQGLRYQQQSTYATLPSNTQTLFDIFDAASGTLIAQYPLFLNDQNSYTFWFEPNVFDDSFNVLMTQDYPPDVP